MTKKLMFDTLSYSKKLAQGGVVSPDVFSEALVDALSQNLNTKWEVDKMVSDAIKHFEDALKASTHELKTEMAKDREAFRKDGEAFRKEIYEISNSTVARLGTIIGIPVGVLTLLTLLNTFGIHLSSLIK